MVLTAVAMQMARDELWRVPRPLAADCGHDLLWLLVIEPRQTVVCRKCGGLDVDTSRRILTALGRWADDGNGAPVALLDTGQRIAVEENRA
jgi:hypothetical protein